MQFKNKRYYKLIMPRAPKTSIRSKFADDRAHSWVCLNLEDDPVKGKKLTAAQPIQQGELVLTYEGLLTQTDNSIDLEKGGNYSMYVKFNQKKWKIDAGDTPDPRYGYGRYINHSSVNPNMTWKVAQGDAAPFVYFSANKNIERGEELMFNYFQGTKPTAAEIKAFPWLT
jgi:histone-lysine N-methyltransferase SETD8